VHHLAKGLGYQPHDADKIIAFEAYKYRID